MSHYLFLFLDLCGDCTGGNTGKTYNSRVDCGKSCGKYYTDSCGACQRTGRARNVTDCNGVCYGTARMNKCGHCAGGDTGKQINHGMLLFDGLLYFVILYAFFNSDNLS